MVSFLRRALEFSMLTVGCALPFSSIAGSRPLLCDFECAAGAAKKFNLAVVTAVLRR